MDGVMMDFQSPAVAMPEVSEEPTAYDVAGYWFSLSDERRDELLAARNDALRMPPVGDVGLPVRTPGGCLDAFARPSGTAPPRPGTPGVVTLLSVLRGLHRLAADGPGDTARTRGQGDGGPPVGVS